ncbi:MAG: hypothetical protein ABWK00_07060 [Desulfurococcaceae archaeon]
MACFLVPLGLGIVVKAIEKVLRGAAERLRLNWLSNMLLGGAGVLALEHMWHGEVVPWPPFLTAMSNPADIPVMLHEMATAGVAMSVAVSALWGGMVYLATRSEKLVEAARPPKRITGAI